MPVVTSKANVEEMIIRMAISLSGAVEVTSLSGFSGLGCALLLLLLGLVCGHLLPPVIGRQTQSIPAKRHLNKTLTISWIAAKASWPGGVGVVEYERIPQPDRLPACCRGAGARPARLVMRSNNTPSLIEPPYPRSAHQCMASTAGRDPINTPNGGSAGFGSTTTSQSRRFRGCPQQRLWWPGRGPAPYRNVRQSDCRASPPPRRRAGDAGTAGC